jgi:hypothetical protein
MAIGGILPQLNGECEPLQPPASVEADVDAEANGGPAIAGTATGISAGGGGTVACGATGLVGLKATGAG